MKNYQFFFCFLIYIYTSRLVFASDINIDIYADDSYPPYSYNENGEPKGISSTKAKKKT